MKEINYETAYNALLEMHQCKMNYSIERLTEEDGYDGCLMTGDHFYLREFAPFVKKYGYDVIEKIVRDIWEGSNEEGSD